MLLNTDLPKLVHQDGRWPRHLNFQRLVISCFQVAIWLKYHWKRRKSSILPTNNQLMRSLLPSSSCWAHGRTRRIRWLYWSYLFEGLIDQRVLSPGCPSLGRMPHSPYYFFRGGVHLPVLPTLHLCMHVCGECWRVCNWSVCPGLGFHQLFIVPGHRKQCEQFSSVLWRSLLLVRSTRNGECKII